MDGEALLNILLKNYDVQIGLYYYFKKQYEYTKNRMIRLGLNNRVNVKFLDYRDLKDKYDAIASIEMIEAKGEKYLNKYFSTIKNNLKPNGHWSNTSNCYQRRTI